MLTSGNLRLEYGYLGILDSLWGLNLVKYHLLSINNVDIVDIMLWVNNSFRRIIPSSPSSLSTYYYIIELIHKLNKTILRTSIVVLSESEAKEMISVKVLKEEEDDIFVSIHNPTTSTTIIQNGRKRWIPTFLFVMK